DPFEYEVELAEADAASREASARLIELTSEIAAERELLRNDEAQEALLERDFTRRRDLRRRGAGTQSAADDAELELVQARQATIARRQTIARLGAMIDQQAAMVDSAEAALRRAKRNMADTRLVAPFTGVLTDVADVARGKRMGVGDPVAKLIEVGTLEARVQLPDADFARLVGPTGDAAELIGTPAELTWKIGREGFRFLARIARIGAEVDPASGGVDIFLAIDDAEAGVLRPGAFVEAAFPDRPLEDVFLVPVDALTTDGALHLIDAEDRLQPQRPTVVRRLGDRIAVRGDWPDGSRFVTKRFPEIGPGLKVLAR
ncbi:MAG: HlyD family efflux transporter periplasmic adaptor subunit, partial [Pseudomonadota bacterium]